MKPRQRKSWEETALILAMNPNERVLAWLLRLGGVVMLTALGAMVMPFDWMNTIHRQLGMGELSNQPIMGYLTRSISGFYALHGALLVFLAGDVRRFLPVIRFLGLVGAIFGGLLLGIDLFVGLPIWWTAVEGPWVAVLSVVILRLSKRCAPAAIGEVSR